MSCSRTSSSEATSVLIKINVVVFLITRINSRFWYYKFGLVPALVTKKLFIWQPLTYAFLHGSVIHLVLNMFMLHMLAKDLVKIFGERMFLRYYMVSATGAGILTVVISNLFGSNLFIPTIGASGAIFGLLLAYGLSFKNRIVYVFGIYPMKAFNFVILLLVIEFISLPSNSNISHLGHLTGALSGYLYIKYLENKRRRERESFHNTWND